MSTIPKIEQYKIADMNLSIEDYKQKPKKDEHHFFSNEPHKRYHCWVNGGGLSQADIIEEARQILFDWAIGSIDADIYKLNEQLFIRLQAKHLLNDNVENLQGFKVQPIPNTK
jgi:hypothetical protein